MDELNSQKSQKSRKSNSKEKKKKNAKKKENGVGITTHYDAEAAQAAEAAALKPISRPHEFMCWL
ncbi:hypothetical protein N7453_006626 [Penicillium expansum]|nr:hypothetical protein N7453_006626 [Penicillium expansum]